MVYGRDVAGQELTFEASGALWEATLVLRDDQTDSWWSIMTSTAIGGPLEGASLRELPVGRKVQWRDWVAAHPNTRVLSVEGREHVAANHYDSYFDSDRTFRGQAVSDSRLSPKAPIFAFRRAGSAFAVPHRAAEGGRVLRLGGGGWLVVHRPVGAAIHASTEAWLVDRRPERSLPVDALLAALRRGQRAGERVAGFDTFWYTWVGIQEQTRILGNDR